MPYILAVKLDNSFNCSANRSWAPWSLRSLENVILHLPEYDGFYALSSMHLRPSYEKFPINTFYLGSSLEVKLSLKLWLQCQVQRG